MADKFIRHGETYCGDGTSSAAATSAGGVGAWNDINVFEGSAPAYGSLNAGDTVYIRSKDASGVDITRALTANITISSSSATSAYPITWVLDDGIKWPGISGTLTYECSAGNYGVTWRDYNNLYASDEKFVVLISNAAYSLGTTWAGAAGVVRGLKIDTSATTGNGGYIKLNETNYTVANYINLSLKLGRYWAYATSVGSYAEVIMTNPLIEVTNTAETDPLFNFGLTSVIRLQGGELFGAAAVEGFLIAQESPTSTGILHMNGFKYPRVVKIGDASYIPPQSAQATLIDGLLGSEYVDKYCTIDSRNDGLYPTLRATLPDSGNSGWSYRVYPHGATKSGPAKLHVKKLYTLSAATKTITLDFLSCDTMPTPKSNTYWMEVSYTDATTGNKVFLTTLDHSATTIPVSVAGWSSTSYGAVALTKRKLSVTTLTSIKQDTTVEVNFYSTDKASNSSEIFFIDPDPEFS